MEFDPGRLRFLEKRLPKNGGKPALEYSYDGLRFLVYPQVFPFGGSGEDVTIHYRMEDRAMGALMDDARWLSGALAFFEKDYYARLED